MFQSGKNATRKSSRSDQPRLQAPDASDKGTTDERASDEIPREDVVSPAQAIFSEKSLEVLALDNETPPQSRHEDSEDTINHVSSQIEGVAVSSSTRTFLSSPPVKEAEPPASQRTTVYGEKQVKSSVYPIPVSPITPQTSPTKAAGTTIPSPTKNSSPGKSGANNAVSDAGLPENPEVNIDCIDNQGLNTESGPPIRDAITSRCASPQKSREPKRNPNVFYPGDSPQIGTSLLKRESLRKRETSVRKFESRKTRSPKKRDTLSRRDTLQEREILQKVIAEKDQPHTEPNESGTNENIASIESKPELELPDTEQIKETTQSRSASSASEPLDNANSDIGVLPPACTNLVERDLPRAMEAIEVFKQPVSSHANDVLLDDPVNQNKDIKATDKVDPVIVAAILDEAARTMEAATEEPEPTTRKTRSAARFSDDTSLLRDFLNRAQASKAAKTPVLLPLDAPRPQISPRRSPRKTPGSNKGTASTSQQLTVIANRPGTPPGTTQSVSLESDDAEEITATPTSCRRSSRTRLPAPSKTPPGAPSFIPLRRADGADPVILQRSQAQELAMTTRANTRRNKGQSKPPLLVLKEISTDPSEVPVAARHCMDSAKAVGWAEKLATYQGLNEGADDTGETKPKVRRMKGLGAANGTPGPKKSAAVVNNSNGTPAPKRRGKAMTGK